MNCKWANIGLHELSATDEMTRLAMSRVAELTEKYNHERPDGTKISQTCQ